MSKPPKGIRVDQNRKNLTVVFDDDDHAVFSAEFLRVESPSAEVQGHHPSERRIIGGKRDVVIQALEPVGSYAIRIIFDDGHDTGLYSWDYLATLGRDHDRLWQTYLDGLAAQGLSRDP